MMIPDTNLGGALSNLANKASSTITSYVGTALPIPSTLPIPGINLKLPTELSPESILKSINLPVATQSAVNSLNKALTTGYPAVGELDYRQGLTGTAKANQDKYNDTVRAIASKTDGIAAGTSVDAVKTKSTLFDERLYTILPRSAVNNMNRTSYKGDNQRGEVAYLKLLTKKKGSEVRARVKGVDASDVVDLIFDGYQKFFLTDVQINYTEKVQITNTFGDGEVAYFFGRQPMIFNVSGIIFDSIGDNWFTSFLSLYTEIMRGTRLAQNYELLQLVLPNLKIKGSILSLSHQQNAASDQSILFSFQFLAKEVVPIPIPTKYADVSKLSNQLVSFSAGGKGANYGVNKKQSATLKSKSWGVGGYQTISPSKTPSSLLSSGPAILDNLGSVSDKVAAFTNSLFSPVYGILTTITKVVQNATGTVTSLLTSLTAPVNLILKNITNIADQAIGVVNLIESGVSSIVGIPGRTVADLKSTLNHLKNAAGVISRLPEDISQIVQRSVSSGSFRSGSAMLSSGNPRIKPKAALLSSGRPYSPRTAYTI